MIRMSRVHVDATRPLTNKCPKDYGRSISSNPELSFESEDSGWKALNEQNVMEIPERGFDMV
jgi:hypothetical protein